MSNFFYHAVVETPGSDDLWSDSVIDGQFVTKEAAERFVRCGVETALLVFRVKYEAKMSTDELVEKFNQGVAGVILRASVTPVPGHLKWYSEFIDQRQGKGQVLHCTFFATKAEARRHVHKLKVAMLDEEGIVLAGSSILEDSEKVDDIVRDELQAEGVYRSPVQWAVCEVKEQE